jgi:hypothetical protein
MLQTTTVEKETLKLLKVLMSDEMLSDTYLVGGTALALCLGHRKSVDLDLFGMNDHNPLLLPYLKSTYDFKELRLAENTIVGKICDIKTDFISYKYPLIDEPIIEEGIRLYSLADISAMKLLAIRDTGSRLKDFVDIACLSTKMSCRTMLDNFDKKYKNTNPLSPLKALLYHDDFQFDRVVMINGNFSWKLIQGRLTELVKDIDKVFDTLPINNF